MEKRLKLAIEVRAGIIPGQPMEEHSKNWYMTREEFDNKDTWLAAIGAAHIYALTLQDPARLNWVKLEWIWV